MNEYITLSALMLSSGYVIVNLGTINMVSFYAESKMVRISLKEFKTLNCPFVWYRYEDNIVVLRSSCNNSTTICK